MIKLYSKTVCPKCLLVKTVLNSSGLEFEMLNIDNDENAKQILVDKGFMGVPIMEVEGGFISDVKEMQAKIAELV